MGDTHMFEVSRSSQRTTAAGGRSVLPPRDRESHHSGAVDAKVCMLSVVSILYGMLKYVYSLYYLYL